MDTHRCCPSWLVGCFLVLGSVVSSSSSLPTAYIPMWVSCPVGSQAVLPCRWGPRLRPPSPPPPPAEFHVQWETPLATVMEQQGALLWQAEEFRDRAEVPGERLAAGDCSLVLSDVQIRDAGLYQSYMLVGGAPMKKIFIQSVRLSVHDHKSTQSRGPGEDLVLDLRTLRSMRVVFYGRNSTAWSDLWRRGVAGSRRVEKDPERERLTLKGVTASDSGYYKVLDEHGLAVSTVLLTVQESGSKLFQVKERTPASSGGTSTWSPALVLSSLLACAWRRTVL